MNQSDLIKEAIKEIQKDKKELIKEAIKEVKKEEEKKRKKSVYHNTELLMRHYNDFKKHYDEAKSEACDINIEIDIDNIDDDELYIRSIKRSKIKTLIMISHIEFALDALKEKQKKRGTKEKYKALELHYIHEKTYDQVAEIINCAPISARRWIKEMTEEMSIYLFGIEALKI